MNKRKTERTAAIYGSVPMLPTELCGLIADYDSIRPYTWTADGLGPTARCLMATDGRTELKIDDTLTVSSPWRTFVSESTLADGPLDWTVEFGFEKKLIGWIGAGLTTAKTNSFNTILTTTQGIADRNSWIVSSVDGPLRIAVFHDWRRTASADLQSPHQIGPNGSIRLRFTVDPKAGTVGVRWRGGGVTSADRSTWFVDPAICLNLADLRPCVVLSGPTKAVVRSGMDDDDDGFPVDCLPVVSVGQ